MFEFLGMTRIDNILDGETIIRATWRMNGYKGISLAYPSRELLEDESMLIKYVRFVSNDEAVDMWERDKWKIKLWWPVRDWLNRHKAGERWPKLKL